MNSYFVMLNGEYSDFIDEIAKLGKVTYISPVREGFIGLETEFSKEQLHEYRFIKYAEEMGYGTLCKTQ